MHGTLAALKAAARIAARARALFGAGDETLDAASLLREAGGGAPAGDVRDALEALLASLAAEADLDAFGRIAARTDARRKLAALARMDAAERQDPGIAARTVAAPVVITGLPRSGTSFLHGLLALHPRLRAPRTWEVIEPVAADPAAARARTVRELRFFARLVPELASHHPLSADTPQECSEILGHVFRSLRYETTFSVPGYRRWLRASGLDAAYRFHRRFLQHLGGGAADTRFVLKSPDHVFCLAALRRTYPDAVLVFVHRDPARVLASVARLTVLLRRPFAHRVDPLAIGRQVVDDWTAGIGAIVAEADADPGIVHVAHRALVADPVGVASGVLAACGLDPGGAASRIAASVAARPTGGYGRHRYRMEAYGIEPREFASVRRDYMARFGIGDEA